MIAYMLLAGMPPFLAPSDEGVKLKIKWTKVCFTYMRQDKTNYKNTEK